MSSGTPRPRRPRPVADAPLDALLAGGGRDLARGWLLTLLEDRALEAAAQMPAADLAREAPDLMAAVVRGLASDAELARLSPGGDLHALAARAGALAGAAGAADTAAAIDDMRAVVWAATLACVPNPSPEQVADLAERAAHVAAVVRAAALESLAATGRASSAPPAPGLAAVPGSRPAGAPPAGVHPAGEPRAGEPPAGEPPAGEPPAGEPPAGEPQAPVRPPRPAPLPTDEGWLGAVREHVAGAASGGSGLSLLLVEVEDHERLAAAGSGGAADALGAAGRAIRHALRRPDVIACEQEGRVWVIAAGAARRGAEALAARLAEAVSAAAAPHGAPLRISVGIAVYGEDAWDAEALIAAADEAGLAARASGARTAGGDDSPPTGPRLVG